MATTFSPALRVLSDQIAQIASDVYRAVAARGGRDHSLIPLVVLACLRINRTVQRFQRLLARIAAGRPAPVRKPGGTRVCKPRDPAAFRLPRGFLWLVVRMPETASFGSQLRHLLDQPDAAALLAADPRAGRILRPLCRMLGVANPLVGTREPASAGPARRPAPRPAKVPPLWAALAGPLPFDRDGQPASPPGRNWRRSD